MSQREKIATWPTDRANRVAVRAVEALSGNRTITPVEIESWQALVFNPSTTARDVLLPAVAVCQGVMVFIGNTGTTTGVLNVKDSAGTVIAQIGSVAGATDVSGGWFLCDGTAWYGVLGA